MKKLLWMVMSGCFLLYGCGGGGSTGSSLSPSNGGGNQVSGTTSGFTLHLQDGGSSSPGKLVAAYAAATKARVVVRQTTNDPVHHHDAIWSYDGEGNPVAIIGYNDYDTTDTRETYRRVVSDLTITDGKISFTTPVSASPSDVYQFDVLTYIPGTPNTMVKFGTLSGVEVGSSTSANIPMNDINEQYVTYNLPSSTVKSDQNYSVTVTTTGPLGSRYELAQSVASAPFDITTPFPVAATSGRAVILRSPSTSTATDTTLSIISKVYIADNLLDSGNANDRYTNWVRISPTGSSSGESHTITLSPLVSVLSGNIL